MILRVLYYGKPGVSKSQQQISVGGWLGGRESRGDGGRRVSHLGGFDELDEMDENDE
jgi:hypothetical protein